MSSSAFTGLHSPYWSDEVSSLGGLDSTTKESSESDVFVEEPLRLNMSHLNLVRRKNEVLLLMEAFQRIRREEAQSEVVLINGSSGTGKTALAEAIRHHVTLKANGFYTSGKFDQIRNEPLSAIVEAFSDQLGDARHVIRRQIWPQLNCYWTIFQLHDDFAGVRHDYPLFRS